MTTAATAVAVIGSDPLVREGAVAYLGTYPGIMPVAADSLDRADVVLVIAGQVSDETLCLMQRAARQVPDRELRFVLVCDAIRESQLLGVLSMGMVSVLLRGETDYERIVHALAIARDGRTELPQDAHGPTDAGLFRREIDVLRLLADGYATLEIAERLNYSERTVRNIIHGVLTRMKLRNRAHAVAFALRSGVI